MKTPNDNPPTKVYVKSMGCKVNTYDGDSILTELTQKGFIIVDDAKDADVSILNSCSVTAQADRESRYLLRRFKRENPNSKVIATGCYAQTDSEALIALDVVDLVVPNAQKQSIVDILKADIANHGNTSVDHEASAHTNNTRTKLPDGVKPVSQNRQNHFKAELNLKPADPSRTRSFLKIQDGCNGFCSYCIIPYARGSSRSVKAEEIKKEIRRQIDIGTKEVVLTGIHIGDFGQDEASGSTSTKDHPFTRLLEDLFDWPDMVRLRISSLEPMELKESMLKALKKRPELFCDHFHMPLQSGHDRILKLMRRTYDTRGYADKLALAKSYYPKGFFSADVIPGFPSETDEEAEATMAFIQAVGLNELHVFPYSKRPNTAAFRMPGHLSSDTIKARAKTLRHLSQKLKQEYIKGFIGHEVSVLWEQQKSHEMPASGRSLNYLEIIAARSASDAQTETGTISRVKLQGLYSPSQLLGVPVP